MNGLERWLSGRRKQLDPVVVSRLVSVVLFLGTGVVLLVAMWLEPAEAGHGTHRQLGLGQCSFLGVTGQPCPMCGATTTFTLMAHGMPIVAALNQPFAAFLFTLTVGVFAIALVELFHPRNRWGRLLQYIEPFEGRAAVGFLAFMGMSWAYKAWIMTSL